MTPIFSLAFLERIPAPPALAAIVVVIFLAIGIHEYCHAKFADMAGDPTPGSYGRVTLNLTKHFEPLGTLMMVLTSLVGVGLGWGKPVPMDPSRMRNPKWDHFVAVAAGPLSNLFQAVIFAGIWRMLPSVPGTDFFSVMQGQAGFFPALIANGVALNIGLFIFNLIPLGPLDGMWLLGTFMSEPARLAWTRFNLGPGQFLFLGFIIVGQLTNTLGLILGIPQFLILRALVA